MWSIFPILSIPGEGWKRGEWASSCVVLSWYLGLNHSTGTGVLPPSKISISLTAVSSCCSSFQQLFYSLFCRPTSKVLWSHLLLLISHLQSHISLVLVQLILESDTVANSSSNVTFSAQECAAAAKKQGIALVNLQELDFRLSSNCTIAHCLISGVGLIILKRANITPSDFKETGFKYSRNSIQYVCFLPGFFRL